MKRICSDKVCTGCGACMNVCPKNCITLNYDADGFLQPAIDQARCVDCRKCQQICPINSGVEKNVPIRAVVACSTNNEYVLKSSSGGLFSELAQYFFDLGGVVCGAVFDPDFLNIHHCIATNFAELAPMRGSKYIQSNVNMVYAETKKHLKDGRAVLFSGTPCQIAALKSYLGDDYPNLVTVDFICHGVASSKAYYEYLKSLNIPDAISDIKFRHKQNVDSLYVNQLFRIDFENQKFFESNWLTSTLGFAFANNLVNRISCASCLFATPLRVSDITLGDYISDLSNGDLERMPKCAKSLVLLNTAKGVNVFDRINNRLRYCEIELQKAVSVSKHLSEPAVRHKNRKSVFKLLGKISWKELSEKCFTVYKPKRTLKSILKKILH